MDIFKTIKQRKSIRNYLPEKLTQPESAALETAIANSTSPFGGYVSIILSQFDLKEPYKPSTYGVISGASDYLLMAFADDEKSELSAGYMFESIILHATEMSLGTCWIGGTFKNSSFNRDTQWPEGESLKIISPVGHPSGKTSLLERLERAAVGSSKRKPFAKVFFNGNFDTPLTPEASVFSVSLEMLRLAPSSLNTQPWRALVSESEVHFYYKNRSSRPILNSGIALYHFHASEQAQNRHGIFKKTNAPTPPEGFTYLTSYTL